MRAAPTGLVRILDADLIAKQLGHISKRVTIDHYIDPGATEAQKQERVFQVLAGGRR